MDRSLPDIDGAQLLQQLGEIRPNSRLFVMTGHGTAGVATGPQRPLLEGVFRKPFSRKALAAVF
jgi:DNA-binding NtrC family response regulator